MARRKKRSKFGQYVSDLSDEAAGVVSLGATYGLGNVYRDYVDDARRAYYKNIRSATKIKQPLPPMKPISPPKTAHPYGPTQQKFGFIKPLEKKLYKSIRKARKKIVMDPLLTQHESVKLREIVKRNFSKPTRGSKFRWGADIKRTFLSLTDPYSLKARKSGFKPPSETLAYLKKANRRSLRKLALMPRRLMWTGALLGTAFGAIPLAKWGQARYSKSRKFKKEFRKRVYRGVITPAKGYAYGSALDRALQKYPALRGSRKIRSLEGKYAQMYGQGVQFYKGTSGMRREEIQKLDRDLKRIVEQRRRAKRRRGK